MSSAPINMISWLAGTPCSRRTAVLGGHLYGCDRCGHRVKVFNSCRNRSCPKCQATTRAKWLANGRTSSCLFLTSMSCSLFRSRSAAWHFRTQGGFTPFCFRPLRKLCSPLPPIPDISAPVVFTLAAAPPSKSQKGRRYHHFASRNSFVHAAPRSIFIWAQVIVSSVEALHGFRSWIKYACSFSRTGSGSCSHGSGSPRWSIRARAPVSPRDTVPRSSAGSSASATDRNLEQ